MMRFICSLTTLILALWVSISSGKEINEPVVNLVKTTVTAIKADAPQTLESILFGDHPYKDQDDPSLYVFVLDTTLTVAAHPIFPHLAGTNLAGKPDTRGKLFREEMLDKAVNKGSGWVDYYYLNPKTQQEALKLSYFELVTGSDGKQYIVGSGKYATK
ncbi:MAG: cache domain-containing protein [bacterium]